MSLLRGVPVDKPALNFGRPQPLGPPDFKSHYGISYPLLSLQLQPLTEIRALCSEAFGYILLRQVLERAIIRLLLDAAALLQSFQLAFLEIRPWIGGDVSTEKKFCSTPQNPPLIFAYLVREESQTRTTDRKKEEIPMKMKNTMSRMKQVWAIGAVAAGLILATITLAESNYPGQQQIAFAKQTNDLMFAAVLAALGQEFAQTTPANVHQGSQSIFLIFDNNKSMRLVGQFDPLNPSDQPRDSFETIALAAALNGQNYTNVEKDNGKYYYRSSVALSNFSPSCSLCHTNFGPMNSQEWVGALMQRVPVRNN